MSKFASSINLQLSPDSLSQGESAIRQELALQLKVFNNCDCYLQCYTSN